MPLLPAGRLPCSVADDVVKQIVGFGGKTEAMKLGSGPLRVLTLNSRKERYHGY